ncbi:hypothetical protein TNCV_2778491 [Trichonephila clavipes]|nr:hypothetical protein TNCV_2778491 [Trichonephila clavipes]
MCRVIADIRPQMLKKVIENWTSRLDYIRASRGSPMPEIIFKMSSQERFAYGSSSVFQSFLENSTNVIDHDLIEFISNFDKYSCDHQVTKNDADLAVSPICCQVSVET